MSHTTNSKSDMAYMNIQSARDMLYEQDLVTLRQDAEQLRPDLDVEGMNAHQLVQVILSALKDRSPKRGAQSARRTTKPSNARRSAAPYSSIRIRSNVPESFARDSFAGERDSLARHEDDLYDSCGSLEPIRVLQRRITEARRPRPEVISDFGSKSINGTPGDVWGGSLCQGNVCEEDVLDNALSAARRRGDNLIVSHRLVSTSLVPVDCDKPFSPSERSEYRRTRFSPRPASLNHIRNHTNSHYVPVIRLVTGDDRQRERYNSARPLRYREEVIDLTLDDGENEAYYLL